MSGDAAKTDALARLNVLRRSIDNIDAALVHLLAERFRVTSEVGFLKAAHDLPSGDPTREAQVVGRVRDMATNAGLDPDVAQKISEMLIAEAIANHDRIKARRDADA